MSITRRCDYACRIIRAAYRSGDTYISIAEVAEQESIPYSFCSQHPARIGEGGPAENHSRCERRPCSGVRSLENHCA